MWIPLYSGANLPPNSNQGVDGEVDWNHFRPVVSIAVHRSDDSFTCGDNQSDRSVERVDPADQGFRMWRGHYRTHREREGGERFQLFGNNFWTWRELLKANSRLDDEDSFSSARFVRLGGAEDDLDVSTANVAVFIKSIYNWKRQQHGGWNVKVLQDQLNWSKGLDFWLVCAIYVSIQTSITYLYDNIKKILSP